MKKDNLKSIYNLLSIGIVATSIASCTAGATTPDVCAYPSFTNATAQSLVNAWGNGLQYYQTNPQSDLYVNAGYFTMSFYAPDALLQPTLSGAQRFGTQNIYDYFTSFLAKKPIISFNPELNFASALGCGFGGYSGYYNFVTESGTPFESVTNARFTFIYEYIPKSFTEIFTVESGAQTGVTYTQQNPSNWYIIGQQSSVVPSGN